MGYFARGWHRGDYNVKIPTSALAEFIAPSTERETHAVSADLISIASSLPIKVAYAGLLKAAWTAKVSRYARMMEAGGTNMHL